jgi:cation diffusion facilitator family transporter
MIDARTTRGLKAAFWGIIVNAVLAMVKLIAGLLGNSYALIADAVESLTDIFGSAIVWSGLTIATAPPDEDHPYGHGKAEALAAAAVSLMLLAAALGIAIEAVREILSPHHAPAPFTLFVLIGVVIVKETLYRTVFRVGREIGSTAVKTDAWHHRSDAITSAAAAVGISVALIGGRGYEAADDWAALLASGIIAFNGLRLMRPALDDLMDRTPNPELTKKALAVAESCEGVKAAEKHWLRKVGFAYYLDLHLQVAPTMDIVEAHRISHLVKDRIQAECPEIVGVLIHVEPFQPPFAAVKEPEKAAKAD